MKKNIFKKKKKIDPFLIDMSKIKTVESLLKGEKQPFIFFTNDQLVEIHDFLKEQACTK